MATVSTYLNFTNSTEAAFNFYAAVFGTEITEIMRHGDVPPHEGQVELSDADKQLIMNVVLPILGGHILMGTDVPDSMGMSVVPGNNIQITLHPDSRGEADKLHAALSEGGTPGTPMMEMFWGDYYGDLVDKFGIRWLINTSSKN